MADSRITTEEYQQFHAFLEEACGIVLGDNKQYLISSRLGVLMKEQKIASLGELVQRVKRDRSSKLRVAIIEAMTTNETNWFRDIYPFEVLTQRLLPEAVQKGARTLRIWSAACSSGQEPYSISIAVQEYLAANPGTNLTVQIVATDISPGILKFAGHGFYDNLALNRGLSPARRQRFFKNRDAGAEVCPEVRNRVKFMQLNLLQSYALLGRFDVVFCRNVLIYFSTESKRDILARIGRSLNPGGYLFLGASESITNYSSDFDMVRCNPGVVYKVKR